MQPSAECREPERKKANSTQKLCCQVSKDSTALSKVPHHDSKLESDTSRGSLRCPCERFHHRAENHQSIFRIQRGFHSPLRMRHQSRYISSAIADSGDIFHRPIRIPRRIILAVRRSVAKQYLPIFLEFRKRRFITGVIAVVMCNRNSQDLSA